MPALFAVKEAVAKVFGTGFRTFMPGDIEVLRDELGKPYVRLYGGALEQFEKMGMEQIHVSISNTNGLAMAFCSRRRKESRKMRTLLLGRKMKATDAKTIQEIGIPSMVLMERAAMAVAAEAEKAAKKMRSSGLCAAVAITEQTVLQRPECSI